MATWAARRQRGKAHIDRALKLLWGMHGLRLLLHAIEGERGVSVIMNVVVTVLFLLIMGAAVRRGERLARRLLGVLALVGGVSQVFYLEEMDAVTQILFAWPLMLALFTIGVLLLDGRSTAFYLREQQLHTRYRRLRQQAPLRRTSAS